MITHSKLVDRLRELNAKLPEPGPPTCAESWDDLRDNTCELFLRIVHPIIRGLNGIVCWFLGRSD